jgi:hypothetical protein
MSSISSDTHKSFKPHILCEYCRAICESSVIIQTYTKYGNDETNTALRQRCLRTKQRERFNHCSMSDFHAGYQTGCHLCTMLWYRSMGDGDTTLRLMQEGIDFEEKNGISQKILTIDCNNTVEIALCTRTEDFELLRGFGLQGYLVRDFQGNSQLSFYLKPYL